MVLTSAIVLWLLGARNAKPYNSTARQTRNQPDYMGKSANAGAAPLQNRHCVRGARVCFPGRATGRNALTEGRPPLPYLAKHNYNALHCKISASVAEHPLAFIQA